MFANRDLSPAPGYADTDFLAPDRRETGRVHTVYFVVKVIRDGDAGLFRMCNISDGGAKLAAHIEFTVGERVWIELSRHLAISGTVMWCEDQCWGVQFDWPIDSAAALHARAEERLDRRACALRLPVNRLATCYSESGIRMVTVDDVSRRGVGVSHQEFLNRGMLVKLVLESGTARQGVVRWARSTEAGIRLDEPLTCEELESARHI
jgi:hypothetical protein